METKIRSSAKFRTRTWRQLNGGKVGKRFEGFEPSSVYFQNRKRSNEIYYWQDVMGTTIDHAHRSKPNHTARAHNINDCFPRLELAGLLDKRGEAREAGELAAKTSPMTRGRRAYIYVRQTNNGKLMTPTQRRRHEKKLRRNLEA